MKDFTLNECKIKYGCDDMDFVKVTDMLSHAYWSRGIKIDEVKKGASHSALVTGVFYADDQIGYGRVVSDKTRFAYIMDVYVDENFRRRGIGQFIIKSILGHESLKDVYQWVLITDDAHGVYAKTGFKALQNPDLWMEIRNQRPQR